MSLAEFIDGPAPGHPAGSPVRRRSLGGAASAAPPAPRGGSARRLDPRGALAAPPNEPGDDGSPTRALGGGTVDEFRERL